MKSEVWFMYLFEPSSQTLKSLSCSVVYTIYLYFVYMYKHGRPRRRWEDAIKMDLQEVGCGGMDWIELPQDRDRFEHL